MPTLRQLFPQFNMKISLRDIAPDRYGEYNHVDDVLVLQKGIAGKFPLVQKIVVIHEMFHATMVSKRSGRLARLVQNLGEYKRGSLSYRTEECIVEICSLITCLKLGILTKTSAQFIESGFEHHYNKDIYIPWREVTAALRYFSSDEIDFTRESQYIKKYLSQKYKMDIRETYDLNDKTA